MSIFSASVIVVIVIFLMFVAAVDDHVNFQCRFCCCDCCLYFLMLLMMRMSTFSAKLHDRIAFHYVEVLKGQIFVGNR